MAKNTEELIHDLARVGLRKLQQANIQAQFRIQEAQRKLAEAQGDEMLAISILGDPVEQERQLMEQKALHREQQRHMRDLEDRANGRHRQEEFEPIAVDSYMSRAR
jgi:hypothetical protein